MNLIFRPIDVWPGERTARPKPSNFEATWGSTLELLDREVAQLQRRRRATDVVVQLAVPEGAIRQDGKLAAKRRPPEHNGVIVSFESEHGPLRLSCDRFVGRSYRPTLDGWQHNVRAIALGLEALRRVERYGIGTGSEQYTGFQALGSGDTPDAPLSRSEAIELLGIATGMLGARAALQDGRISPNEAWRLAAKHHHPDVGGDPALFRRLTEARDLLAGAA